MFSTEESDVAKHQYKFMNKHEALLSSSQYIIGPMVVIYSATLMKTVKDVHDLTNHVGQDCGFTISKKWISGDPNRLAHRWVI